MSKINRFGFVRGSDITSGVLRLATNTEAALGDDDSIAISAKDAKEISAPDGTTTVKGKVRLATIAETQAGVSEDIANTPAGLAAVAIAGAPDATTGGKGILELSTDAEAVALADATRAIVPSNLAAVLAAPGNIGGTTPGNGTFVDLNVDATGDISLDADTASHFAVAGAGVDLTLESALGRVIVNAEEAAANAITLLSAAGGLDVDVALQMNLASSQNAADAIVITSSAGGIDVTAAGAAGEDIDVVCTAGSMNLSAGEDVANAIVINATTGGIDIVADGAAGKDLDLTCTSGSVNITAGENAGDSIVLTSSIGGIQITAAGAGAGEDIAITATGSSVNIVSTEAIADAIVIDASNAAGGIDIDCGSGGFALDATAGAVSIAGAVASDFTVGGAGVDLTLESTLGRVIVNAEEAAANAITLLSAAGGIDVNAALEINIDSSKAGVADAVRIVASAANGGIDIDAGTGGIAIDSTGAISLAGDAASDVTVGGAGIDLTLESTLGRVIVNAEEAVANAVTLLSAAGGIDANAALQINIDSSQVAATAIVLNASNAAGGVDIDAGTGGIAIDTTGSTVITGDAASEFSVAGAGIDLTLESAAGRVVINGEEAAANAITLLSAAGGLDTDVALQMNLVSSQVAVDAIVINASAGGVDITAAANDLDLNATAGSVNVTSGEAVGDAVVITASNAAGGIDLAAGTGGIDIAAAGIVTMTPATDVQAAAAVTINANVGVGTFTGLGTAAAASQVLTVNNNICTAGSAILCTVSSVGIEDAQLTIQYVKPAAGSFTVNVKNNGAAALASNIILTYWIIAA